MTKSLKKLLSGALIALVAILAANGLQAFASDTYPNHYRVGAGTPENPEQAVITKHLETPIGTTLPNTLFTFDFTPLGGDDLPSNTQPGPTVAGPAIPSVSTEQITSTTPTVAQPAPRDDVLRATVHTPNALADVVWTSAGVFVYQVVERTTTFTPTNPERENMYFDTIQYNLYVTIGIAPNGDFYVRGTHAWVRGPEGENVGPKLNPNPWRGPDYLGGDLIFENRFIRRTDDISTIFEIPSIPGPGTSVTGPGGIPDPGIPGDLDAALIVTNRVTGSNSSINTTFPFTGTFTHTTLVNEVVADGIANSSVTYGPVTAWIYYNDGDGNFVRGRRGPAGDLPLYYIFTPGAPMNFELRHGEVLIFDRIPIGNIFVMTETDSLGYVPRIDLIVNGYEVGDGAALTQPGSIGTDNVPAPPHRLGESSNVAAFTNVNDPTPITGLITNNLPVILVTVGAIGLVSVTVASKRRRAYA